MRIISFEIILCFTTSIELLGKKLILMLLHVLLCSTISKELLVEM